MIIKHLSDLHINPYYNKVNFEKTKFVLENIVNSEFDHLIITGDIAHDADKESFLLVKDLLKEYNLLDSSKTTITIGNHDIFGGVYTVKDLIKFPEKCKKTNFESKVIEFVNYFEELFIDCYFPQDNRFFPFVKFIDSYALISINTNDVYSSLKNPFASNGKVNDYDFKIIKTLFEENRIKDKSKIILSHHHFNKNDYETKSSSNEIWNKIEGYTLKLRGKKKLLKLFAENKVTAVLHGHNHENKYYERMGINFFNSGGSIDNDNENLATVNTIKFYGDEIIYSFAEHQLDLVDSIYI
ncbi:MAG: metallophosphoesterase [Ignavibacteriales bacterium]|nr:metallophosphoesterase [Ignavibacteriales bacterium]MCB9217908.1 metallophosphoesterase [Ignavibacteriales bacterium]